MPHDDQEEPYTKGSESYDADYCSEDADTVLLSKDGVKFKVHSLVLKLASGTFRDMLTIPRAHGEAQLEPIPLYERSSTLRDLLNTIYPDKLVLPQDADSDRLSAIATAAKKYDMPGSLRILRNFAFDGLCPLGRYELATRLYWKEEIKKTLPGTLSVNLSTVASLKLLQRLDSKSILALQNLRHTRKIYMMSAFNEIDYSLNGSLSVEHLTWKHIHRPGCEVCDSCFPCIPKLENSPMWYTLKYRLSEEYEQHPDCVTIMSDAFWDGLSFAGLWEMRCGRCAKVLIDKELFKESAMLIIETIPDVF